MYFFFSVDSFSSFITNGEYRYIFLYRKWPLVCGYVEHTMKALQALKVRSVKNLEGEDDYRHLEAFCRLVVWCLCTRLDRDCIGQFCLVNDFKIIKGWRKSHNIQLTRGYFCTSAVPWVFLLSGCHIFVTGEFTKHELMTLDKEKEFWLVYLCHLSFLFM